MQVGSGQIGLIIKTQMQKQNLDQSDVNLTYVAYEMLE